MKINGWLIGLGVVFGLLFMAQMPQGLSYDLATAKGFGLIIDLLLIICFFGLAFKNEIREADVSSRGVKG